MQQKEAMKSLISATTKIRPCNTYISMGLNPIFLHTAPSHLMPCQTTLCHATPHYSTPHHTTTHYTTTHHNTPHHATQRHATPQHTTPHYITRHHITHVLGNTAHRKDNWSRKNLTFVSFWWKHLKGYSKLHGSGNRNTTKDQQRLRTAVSKSSVRFAAMKTKSFRLTIYVAFKIQYMLDLIHCRRRLIFKC